MGFGKYGLFIWVMSTMCLIKFSLQFDPIDNYLVDCGSPKNSSVGDRDFLADTSDHHFLSDPEQASVSTANSQPISSTYGSSLYTTARVFNRTSNYTFPVNQHGRHFIRLHFFPFALDGETYNLNDLIPATALTVELPRNHHNLMTQALETVARVNMGNQTVSPENDTLWRFWNSDGHFITQNNFVKYVKNISSVKYTAGGPTRDIAPLSVYGTATKLDTEFSPGALLNMTWTFNVDPEFSYLVRFHFCDIIEHPPSQLVLNIYLNSMSVAKDLNLGERMSNVWGAPYYLDAVTRLSGKNMLNVSIGTSLALGAYPESILNGLEIMKISNSKGNLYEVDTGTKSSASRSKQKVWVVAALAGGAVFIVVVLGCLFFIIRRRNRRKSLIVKQSMQQSLSPNMDTDGNAMFSRSKIGYRFPLIAVHEATDKFSESLVIGIGGFGKVYKGVLSDGTQVAVKRGAPQSHQGLAEFQTEVEMLSQFRHRHLVSLIGYCDERNEMIIIYEYMENGTLKNHLYGSDLPKLNWRQRLEICIGSARGLHYLHTSSSKAIIHRDVKSANILLDENMMAKVADFGLSKNGPELDQTHVSTAVKGSFGYLDPEYMTRQQLTEKSDVYSFGVVMFEILCGRPVIDPSRPRGMVNLVEWVREWRKRGELEKVFDPFLVGKMKTESLEKFVEIAEKCLAEQSVDRPTMGDVLWNLEFALQLEGIEVKRRETENDSSTGELESGAGEGSVGDFVGVSMSRVFSEMVKGEKHEMR
ncbi:Concanavalin A-like lectin/glucanase, subgroup [Cynara cardunculus var. scolymus]|uniref:Concanavalin A-like lectin/glucanase, subgroup n=1 Tax=Cynara cardunculus var. scolymus TaxID=59895 RepID=A0A118K456_CYNCS|nr:Concanavalin A-like lectin/glucanase, subgroup [Cynara cardunculus var. scolymus]